ncbi:MAG: S9 family peptidase [bacterium]|nr:S9 family peptidase [bacterium]
MIRILWILLPVLLAHASETPISEWKTTPVVPIPPVVFGDSAVKTADLLDQVKIEWDAVNLFDLDLKPTRSGTLSFDLKSEHGYGLGASSLTSDGYTKATLEVTGTRPLIIYANGKELAKAATADSGKYMAKSEITLDRTRFDILIATVSQMSDSGDWNFSAVVKQDSSSKRTIATGASQLERPASFSYDAKLEDYGALVLSPDGKLLVLKRTIREGDEYKAKSWYEIWDLDQAKLYHSFSQDGVSGFEFSQDEKWLYYKLSTDEGIEVWKFSPVTRVASRLMHAAKDLESFKALPDGTTIVYSVSKEKPENKTGYDLFRELNDRPTGYNSRRELFVADTKAGLTRQLTKAGEFEIEKWSVSPSGKQVLVVRNIPKNDRPYMTQEFWTCDIVTGATKQILARNLLEYPQNITWIDENFIAYSAGSHDASPEDTVYHNVNQICLYTLNLKTGENKNLTAGQDFSINDEGGQKRILYSPRDKFLYAHVTYRGEQHFAKISLDGKNITYRPLPSNFAFTDSPAFASNGTRVAYLASDFNSPKAVYANSFASPGERKLIDTNSNVVADWELGTMERWNFTNRLGVDIDGWLYKPADFTPDKKWPLIVYYYAGVSPRDERFSIQNQMWMANGYVVYVLNTVGCVGRGQAFADYHAGDWGTEATQDIIEGTEKILAAHPYLDRERMGCYGGSYGGFITLDLLTKTDMFKVAIDMYGISNITNYFGAGTWGYWYSDLASPGQFPWSDKDVYVDKSPIYSADKIKTPLLILHGGIDNNVPWLESDQMFVALKLLGQDVVYARFQNETHNINTKYSNLLLHRQMMLEWFDKYLKDQPEAWDARMKKSE